MTDKSHYDIYLTNQLKGGNTIMPQNYREVFASKGEVKVYKDENGKKKEFTTVLLGSWLGVIDEDNKGWLKVIFYKEEGWVKEIDTSPDSCLKIFFVDVGQGDACLIETPSKRILIDGGPNQCLKNFLTKWKYDWMEGSNKKIRFDAVIVSHFDWDHFNGLISIINDSEYEFGTVYHSGIARFIDIKSQRPSHCDTELGQTNSKGSNLIIRNELLTSFNDLQDAQDLLAGSGLMKAFKKFLEAVTDAHNNNGRLDRIRRITTRDDYVPHFGPNSDLTIEVLAPVTKNQTGKTTYTWFEDDSHTINGNSIVLKLTYGNRTILLGGDLNSKSEGYLLAKYGFPNITPFRVDVAKACHHGAADFTVDFLKAIKPYSTVISSGDNENYGHPGADALGCAGRYARGSKPLIFSTELARSYKSGKDIHYGNIQLRTNGDLMIMAQMYEKNKANDPWDSYVVHS